MKDSVHFQYDKAKFQVSALERFLLFFVKSRCYFGVNGKRTVLVRAKKLLGRFYIVKVTNMEGK